MSSNDNPSPSPTPTPTPAVDTTPLLGDQIFRTRPRFLRRPPSLRGAARFLRRASSRGRAMREPSVRVREAAAEQIEERQSDWAYSKPIVILDLVWNLAFVIVSISVLIMSRHEDPSMPLRLWIIGYDLQCILHMVCVCAEYKKRYSQRNSEGSERGQLRYSRNNSNSSSGSDDMESGDYVSERRQSDDEARLCITFLAFDVFFVVICVAVACVIGIAVCCCLPCIIAILYAVADQEGATKEDIDRLPRNVVFAFVPMMTELNCGNSPVSTIFTQPQEFYKEAAKNCWLADLKYFIKKKEKRETRQDKLSSAAFPSEESEEGDGPNHRIGAAVIIASLS
ncbi:E3 ubiquitin-protein ligase [Sesamum angolense]|uniref:RING-type E3 ubiquitin transferase n=1 Tax=Sesamum angolense TaxID=2727404 RepID=A0AAE1VT18_9LAMI|nr:E3 ubiquitin-protein ligase [Sesamum angolense]